MILGQFWYLPELEEQFWNKNMFQNCIFRQFLYVHTRLVQFCYILELLHVMNNSGAYQNWGCECEGLYNLNFVTLICSKIVAAILVHNRIAFVPALAVWLI